MTRGRVVVGHEHRHLEVGPGVDATVVDQVGHHSGQATTVAANRDRLGSLVDPHGSSRHAAGRHRLTNELGDRQLFDVEANRSGIETRDLEQVLDETLEASDVGDHWACGFTYAGSVPVPSTAGQP